MEMEPFDKLIENLQQRSVRRDPRQLRLSSVVSAIVDVIVREGLEVTPPRVYAKAVVTLEGSLQRNYQALEQLIDSLYTQASLLELLCTVLPFLEASTVSATFATTGRALRSLLESIMAVESDTMDGAFNTKDDISCIPSVLCSLCKASAMLIRCVSNNGAKGPDDKVVRHLFRGTLSLLLDDKHDRVRTAAKKEIGGLLEMEAPKCHSVVLKDVNAHVIASLGVISSAKDSVRKCGEMMNILDLTRSYIMYLDFTTIGEKLMHVLVGLVEKGSAVDHAFVPKKKDTTSVVLVFNIFLSTVLVMVESDIDSEVIDHYAGRVLATLLQVRPNAILRGADLETSSAARELFAQVMLSAVRRLVRGDFKKAAMLLPVTIGHLFLLATENEKAEMDPTITELWFLELKQLIQVELADARVNDPALHAQCCDSCLKVVKPILGLHHQWVNHGPLMCLAELILQASPEHKLATENITTLIYLREKDDPASQSAAALGEAISRVVQGYGVDKFWVRVDFPGLCFSGKLPNGYAWLVQMLRQSGPPVGAVCDSLSFFQDQVLPLARRFDTLAGDGSIDDVSRRNLAAELWSLFPGFCVHPKDLSTSLPKLAPTFVRAMKDKRYPQLLISISTGLDALATGVHERLIETAELIEESEFADCRSDADVLKGLSEKLLPTMFKLVDDLYCLKQGDTSFATIEPRSDADSLSSQASALTCAITSLAKLAPPNLLQSLFTKVIHRLLEASQAEEDLSDKMCSLLALAQALYTSQCLSESSVVLLYRALRPLIATDETQPRTQKRAYKALAELCKSKPFVTSDGRLQELVELLTSSTATSQISARSMRLRCLEAITDSLRGSPAIEAWIYSSLLPEILLCLKDSNKRTRESASNLLMSVSKDGADTVLLIQCVTAAVASETSHMRSAAVTALSKLVHEHGKTDERVQTLIPSILQTVLLLSDDPSREVAKSLLVFVRVAVKTCPPETIKPLLPSVLESLLKYHKGKDRFRGKIKMLMKKLVRIFGYDYLLPLIPESQSQIVAYVKKLPKMDEKAKNAKRSRLQSREKSVDEMMASDEEDSDDEGEANNADRQATGKRGRGTQGGAMGQTLIRNDASGTNLEVKDLTKKVGRAADEFEDSDADDEVKFDDSGRLVVAYDEKETKNDASKQRMDEANRTSTRDRAVEKDPRRHKDKGKKLGDSYKARKAGGDVKRKGQKLDPYAYVPLDGRNYTKKNRRNAVEQLDTVVRGKKRQKR